MKLKEYKISNAERKAFLRNSACRTACERLVQKVVSHYEDSEIVEQELWHGLRTKYKLPQGVEYRLDMNTGELIEIPTSEKARRFLDGIHRDKAVLEYVKGVLNEKG